MGAPQRALPPIGTYVPREASGTVLYGVIVGTLETFLAHARARDRIVPSFVEGEFRAFLDCGIASNGFLRVHCDGCGFDRLVPFSCKGRGFCPSCGGRRMAEAAADLVDRVFPQVPVRQWVLSLPVALRYRMAFDAELTSEILTAFIRVLFSSLRRRARVGRTIRYPQPGAVTFIQRFGDALNLNVHFHVLALDGVFDADDPAGITFIPLESPTDTEIMGVARAFVRRLSRLLDRRGLCGDGESEAADPLPIDDPLLAELCGASVTGRTASGQRAGQRVRRLGDRVDANILPAAATPGCVQFGGTNLHAAVAVPANDRRRLERLCRYTSRPALANDRLSRREDGLLVYRLRHPWRDGTTAMIFDPMELMERLAVLVPPPWSHLVRYHGILAPNASCRHKVIPAPEQTAADRAACKARRYGHPLNPPADTPAAVGPPESPGTKGDAPAAGTGHSWVTLLARVFSTDALSCPRCGHAMRIMAAIQSQEAIRAILECLGLPCRPPPAAPPIRTAVLPFDE